MTKATYKRKHFTSEVSFSDGEHGKLQEGRDLEKTYVKPATEGRGRGEGGERRWERV